MLFVNSYIIIYTYYFLLFFYIFMVWAVLFLIFILNLPVKKWIQIEGKEI